MPVVNPAGVALIKAYEGCALTAYWDKYGHVWTIGYGHTGSDVTPGLVISQQQADALLMKDLASFEKCVNDAVTHDITPNQFAALVSFAYNLGCGSLQQSTLLRYVNAGEYAAASQEFGKWVFGGGIALPGLVKRRQAEAALFSTP